MAGHPDRAGIRLPECRAPTATRCRTVRRAIPAGWLGRQAGGRRGSSVVARLDVKALVARSAKAAADRCVTIRPAPDTMAYVTALLPVAQGVAVYAALKRSISCKR